MSMESIIAGAFFGLILAVPAVFAAGVEVGLIAGAVSGTVFGGSLYLFVNSKTIKAQVAITDGDLLPGEELIASRSANLVVEPKKFGLQKFAYDEFLWIAGMKNKESLGGALYLTNYRLLFKSHRLNRIRGKTSIFLPTIVELENSSFFFVRKMTVSTPSTITDIVVGDVDQLIEGTWVAKHALLPEDVEDLKELVVAHPQLAGDGLESWHEANTMNNVLRLGGAASVAVKLVVNPVGALSSIFIKELLDKTVAEHWQKAFVSRTP